MTQYVLAADGLVKHFVAKRSALGRPLATVKAVDGVSFVLRPGETLALVGESGCGKSTVGRLVMRLIEPTEGRIVLDGEDVTDLDERGFRPFRIPKCIEMPPLDPVGGAHLARCWRAPLERLVA